MRKWLFYSRFPVMYQLETKITENTGVRVHNMDDSGATG